MENFYSYLNVLSWGKFNELNVPINFDKLRYCYEKYKNYAIQYNSSKPLIRRFGISLISCTEKIDDPTAFGSLLEYYDKTGIKLQETDFSKKTEAWHDSGLEESFNEISDHLYRSHFLILKPGGYFPYHRDYNGFPMLRIIITIKNCKKENFIFGLDDTLLSLQDEKIYLVNTNLSHFACNISPKDEKEVVFIVMNVLIDKKTEKFLFRNLKIR
ncbi:MAG: hypothetical protein NZZ41_00965 [Candidatus Dojkabacteria bacterium]|nr:hypothetical protein [Candidatus Dojkabacteria bacterium]